MFVCNKVEFKDISRQYPSKPLPIENWCPEDSISIKSKLNESNRTYNIVDSNPKRKKSIITRPLRADRLWDEEFLELGNLIYNRPNRNDNKNQINYPRRVLTALWVDKVERALCQL